MKIFTPPFYSRKINFLLLGGLILFLSCQSDPIVYNPAGGYEYQKKSFQINNETSETVQGSHLSKVTISETSSQNRRNRSGSLSLRKGIKNVFLLEYFQYYP